MRRFASGVASLVGLIAIWGSALASSDADRAAFQNRHAQQVRAVEAALARQEAAEVAYQQVRHRGRIRGDAKAQVLAEREAANEALAQAEQNLEDILEQARRAGVPPGWMRNNPQLEETAPPASR